MEMRFYYNKSYTSAGHVTTYKLQLVLLVCIGTKFLYDLATIISDQCNFTHVATWFDING